MKMKMAGSPNIHVECLLQIFIPSLEKKMEDPPKDADFHKEFEFNVENAIALQKHDGFLNGKRSFLFTRLR